MSYDCSVALPHGTLGWSGVRDCWVRLIILTYLLLVKYKFGLTTLLQQGIPEQNVNDHQCIIQKNG